MVTFRLGPPGSGLASFGFPFGRDTGTTPCFVLRGVEVLPLASCGEGAVVGVDGSDKGPTRVGGQVDPTPDTSISQYAFAAVGTEIAMVFGILPQRSHGPGNPLIGVRAGQPTGSGQPLKYVPFGDVVW